MGLWSVPVETEILVEADNEKDAIRIAKAHFRDAVDPYNCIGWADEITDPNRIPADWRGALVYRNEPGDKTAEDCIRSDK